MKCESKILVHMLLYNEIKCQITLKETNVQWVYVTRYTIQFECCKYGLH